MPIERLSFANGERVELDKPRDLVPAVRQLFNLYYSQVRILSPGEYDLTPSLPFPNSHNFSLIVHENGTATYRVIPIQDNSVRVKYTADSPPQVLGGGDITAIPEDDTEATIQMSLGDKAIMLYEAIRYIPDD